MSGALLMAASMPRNSGGGGGTLVSITPQSIFKIGNGTGTVTGSYKLAADGKVYNHTGAVLETWLISGVNSDYEARATHQSGSALTTGTMDTWLALSSDRTWTLDAASPTSKTSVFLIEIRDVATSTVQDSASITLDVENTP
jgi:hypothetical protein